MNYTGYDEQNQDTSSTMAHGITQCTEYRFKNNETVKQWAEGATRHLKMSTS